MKTKKKMSMYKKGGKTNPSKRKAPALSPTGRLLDDPRPQEKEFDPYNDPYFLRKDYVESGRKSAIAADAESPYEKKYRGRSRRIDMTADDVQERVNELVRSGEFSKETGAKAKKGIENFRADKDKMMRESGYGRTPEEKKAQDRAIRRMKNKKAKGGMKMPEYMAGGKMKEMMGGGKMMKDMMGGGKMMKGMMDYAMGGKMDKDMMKMYATGGMLKALLKDPKQREMAKKMLGSMEKGGMMKYQEGGMAPDGKKKIV